MNKSASSAAGTKSKYKIVFLGDQNTGKTSIIQRFINNKFFEKANPTIGIDFLGKNVTHKGKSYRLQLWDTAGQERFRSLIPSYLRDAICVIYVFDLASDQTIKNLEIWTQLFKENRGGSTVAVLCGNKLDLQKNFDQTKLRDFQSRHRMPFFQVSACSGENIDEMFFSVIDFIGQLLARSNSLSKQNLDTVPQDNVNTTQPPLSSGPIRIEQPKPQAPPHKRCCGLL